MQRAATAHPVVNIFAKVNFHACNEGMVRSGATSGAVWPCGYVRFKIVMYIERGAVLAQICKTRYFS